MLASQKPEVDRGMDSCWYSVYMFIYGEGFQTVMMTPWKCESKSFKMHMLKNNVFHMIFQSAETWNYILHEGP